MGQLNILSLSKSSIATSICEPGTNWHCSTLKGAPAGFCDKVFVSIVIIIRYTSLRCRKLFVQGISYY